MATRSRLGVGAILAALTVALTACAPGTLGGLGEEDDRVGISYDILDPLVTTNAASEVGSSVNAERLAVRLYPSVYVPGPSGQMIPNTDLVTTQTLPGAQQQVVYTINPEAQFSDGEPVTCVDFLLSYTAGTMPDLFGSHLPLMSEVESLECDLGSKDFTAVFHEGQGSRWRQLFSPGSVLPAHTIAAAAGMTMGELVSALHARDAAALTEVARVWNEGFSLQEFDPALQVSAGPFVIESVAENGDITFARNDNYYGDPARLDKIVVNSPNSVPGEDSSEDDPESTGETQNDSLPRVSESADSEMPSSTDSTGEDYPYVMQAGVGQLTDALSLSDTGVLAAPTERQAFAACIDQSAVAAASSAESGVEVPGVAQQILPHNDPLSRQLSDITEPHLSVDIERARALAGSEIRIGYPSPNPRLEAMVDSIRESCEPAGIEVTEVVGVTRADLDQPDGQEGGIDAFLGPIDPMNEYGAPSARLSEVDALREAETRAWEELATIPLSAQPRIFEVHQDATNVVVYTGLAGIGWNMDRWGLADEDGNDDANDTNGASDE